MKRVHPFHLVDVSPWPLLMSLALLSTAIGLVTWLAHISHSGLIILLLPALIAVQWWRDVLREAKGGYHTSRVQLGLIIGFLLFLLSEVMLFASFFWAMLHSSLSPAIQLGSCWPAPGIEPVNALSIPLLGSCVLLSSGFILTLSHHSLVAGLKDKMVFSLLITVLLGAFFLFLQATEYYYGSFTMADSVFGSVFYMTTGLHGLHVIAGTLFLTVALVRSIMDGYTTEHNINFEFAAWYWHLVDVVWLAVFVIYYYWGGAEHGSTL